MTLLGHWKFDEAPVTLATTAIDRAAGGSGSHDGTYSWGPEGIRPGGVNGRHIRFLRVPFTSGNRIDSFLNNSDFILIPEMTTTFWLDPIQVGGYPIRCELISGGETEPENISFKVTWEQSPNKLKFLWENGAGVDQEGLSSTGILTMNGWQHIGIVRKLFSGGPNVQVEFWKNGVLINTDDNGAAGFLPPTGGASSELYIGYPYWDGKHQQDSVRIYNSDESANIASIYAEELSDFLNEDVHQIVSSDNKTSELIKDDITLNGSRSERDYGGFSNASV